MDLLYSRYASPYSFLDDVLSMNRLAEAVLTLAKSKGDERWWQLYLSLVANPYAEIGSFDDFKRKHSEQRNHNVNLEEVVKDSFDMLQNFNPIAGGEI